MCSIVSQHYRDLSPLVSLITRSPRGFTYCKSCYQNFEKLHIQLVWLSTVTEALQMVSLVTRVLEALLLVSLVPLSERLHSLLVWLPKEQRLYIWYICLLIEGSHHVCLVENCPTGLGACYSDSLTATLTNPRAV